MRLRGIGVSDDLRKRVVEAVFVNGLSRNAAAKLFKVSVASAVRPDRRLLSKQPYLYIKSID
jgi:transposase